MAATLEKNYVPGFQRGPLFTLPSSRENVLPKENLPESELVTVLEGLFFAGKNYRDQQLGMMDRWRAARAWYLNSGSDAGQLSRTYVNIIYEKIESLSGDQSEGRPEFLFLPNGRQDVAIVDLLNEAVPWVWQSQDCQAKYYHSCKGADLYGTYYWKIPHDPKYPNLGSIIPAKPIPPWYIIPAPYATDISTAPWVIECSVRSVGEIEADYGKRVNPELGTKEFFPEIEEDLKQASGFAGVGGMAGLANTVDTTDGTSSTGLVQGIPDTFLSKTGRAGLVIQKEIWIRDGSTEETVWMEDDGFGPPKAHRGYALKYPGGRVLSWANGVLLYDRPNPYRDGRFPYAVFKDISFPDFWYGIGEVEHLIDLQLLYDDTHEIIKSMHLYATLGRTVIDESTGLNEEDMGNRPGELWFTKPGTWDRVKHMPGLSPPAELYSYLSKLEQSSDLITGRHDVTRGINPTGVTAGKALQTLQVAANTRVRARMNDLELALRQVGRLIGSRIQQFWPTEMTIAIAGEKKAAVLQDAGAAEFRDYFISPTDREASFNVQVNASANLEQLKEKEFQTLLQLVSIGVPVSPETLIEAAPISLKDKILAELPLLAAQQRIPPEAPDVAPPSRSLRGG